MPYTDLDPKDPSSNARFKWDVSSHCVQSETTLTGATITEVDAADNVVAVPTVTITGLTFTSDGIVTAFVSGGTLGASVLLRLRYTLANGETGDLTIKLRIAHQ
jgi:hypothetical protein